jgi:hypothetical protein
MTELTFNKNAFLETIEAILTKFELESNSFTLESEPSGDKFILTAKRKDGTDVKAFGGCTVKGEPVSVMFDATELQRSIQETLQNSTAENVTLIVGDGIWVKEPLTYTVSLN